MCYKILLGGMVIDVLDTMRYVKYQQRNNLVLLTDKKSDAFGVLSSDASTVWIVDGLLSPPVDRDYATVSAVEIDEYEAAQLREQLEDGGTAENPEPPSEDVTEPVMTPTEMRVKINSLEEQNAMLEACLLEMSELVYA